MLISCALLLLCFGSLWIAPTATFRYLAHAKLVTTDDAFEICGGSLLTFVVNVRILKLTFVPLAMLRPPPLRGKLQVGRGLFCAR